MVLHDYRLTLFYTTRENGVKMCHFYLRGKGQSFKMFLEMGQSKWPIAKRFVFWDATQSIKLINLIHNKYPSSYESLGKELVMTKVRNESPTKTMSVGQNALQNVHPKYSLK
jgi:hypothetical protein